MTHESDIQTLLAKIDRTERRLAELDAERVTANNRLIQLKSELAHLQTSTLPKPAQVPRAANEKIALFRSLFVGRTDVFPKFWHSRKSGRKGYAPACNNEWVRGICNKPRVKCGECPNQAFIPVSDRVILDHLQGRHVAGVYPLLEDETCRFLAMDFDKGDWKQDVSAVAATCRRLGIPVAIERSRSGDGAHLWYFFTANVPAIAARKMGSYLIMETMNQRHELPMSSYDRLFPNQDTMPTGGFGNLIALPLQFHARQDNNTVFVNEDFVAFSDQWAFIAGIERIDPARVEAIAREASESGQVVGVRMAEDEDTKAPWLSLPSKQRLPPVLINRIKQLAAFQNPEFYKKQAMRLSTALTPRVISGALNSRCFWV